MSAPAALARRIIARDARTCVYCLAVASPAVKLTVDHVIPEALFDRGIASGARHTATNLVACCDHCNSLKRDMTLRVWAEYLIDSHGWTQTDATMMLARVAAAVARPIVEE